MKPSGVTSGIILQVTADLINLGCGFAVFGYLSRRLGSVDYGVYSVAFLLAQWCGDILGIFIGPGTVRMVAGHDHGRRYARTMLVLAVIGGGACGMVLAACAPFFSRAFGAPELCRTLRVLACGLPFTTCGHIYTLILTGQGRHGAAAMVGCGYWLCRLMCAIGLLEAGWGVLGAAAAVSVAEVVRTGAGRLASGVRVINAARMSFITVFRHTGVLAGASCAMRVLNQMDLLAVKYFQPDPSAAGLYAAAQNICLLPSTLFQSSSSVMLRSIAAGLRRHTAATRGALVEPYLRMAVLAAGVTVAMVPLAPGLVEFLLGSSFAAAGRTAGFLLVAVAFRMLAASGRGIAGGYGERAVFVLGLTALAAVAAAVYAWRIPVIAARFAAAGRQPIEAYAIVAAALAVATALGCLMGGVSISGSRFPWITAVRALTGGAIAAWVGSILPGDGLRVLAAVAATAAVYGAVVVVLGERFRFVTPASEDVPGDA
ncbi:MAG: lipopolysaccharide biosynthesis protein [Planctomycetota bacterium]